MIVFYDVIIGAGVLVFPFSGAAYRRCVLFQFRRINSHNGGLISSHRIVDRSGFDGVGV